MINFFYKIFGYDIASPKDRKIPGNYNINYLGLNYRMSEVESAIGIDELKNIKQKIFIRKKLSFINVQYKKM